MRAVGRKIKTEGESKKEKKKKKDGKKLSRAPTYLPVGMAIAGTDTHDSMGCKNRT